VGGISGGYTGGGLSDSSWVPPAETRHDDRIHADVRDRLAMSGEVDASGIEVLVQAGSVTLEGNVETRHMKQIARDIAAAVPGVSSVHNRLHVEQSIIDELKEKLEPQHVPRHR
jgi:osmotically-inducible protein OsmY